MPILGPESMWCCPNFGVIIQVGAVTILEGGGGGGGGGRCKVPSFARNLKGALSIDGCN